MMKLRATGVSQVIEKEWVGLPGGELEAPRPSVLCRSCREKLPVRVENGLKTSNGSNPPLCFGCYRAGLDRDRALKAAGELDTASDARFQSALPLEPVNQLRLARLRQERAAVKVTARAGAGQYIDKRRHAQIAARHALERIVIGLRERNALPAERERVLSTAAHAMELQLPEAWLPFVLAR